MKDGRWVSPRHPDRGVFERDFPKVHLNPLEASCPGCRHPVKLGRMGLGGRLAGWCESCSRAVTA